MSSAKQYDIIAELRAQLESAQQDAESALYLAEHHRAESVQLREQVAELKHQIATLEIEKRDALEMLGNAQDANIELEQEIDGLTESEGSN